jgi:hypothetical protein
MNSLSAALESEEARVVAMASAPFDPRTEVSADAKYIAHYVVKNLVLWFFVLPLILAAILWVLAH